MAQTFEFYNERAQEAAAEAQRAELVNVRERALRAEKAWRLMADQALKTAREREERDAATVARRLAETSETSETELNETEV
jgi:hypothetical protein